MLKQQLHKRCGGKIIIISDKSKTLKIACEKCVQVWKPTSGVKIPNDFISVYKDKMTIKRKTD